MNKLPFFFLADDDPDDHLLFTDALQEINMGIQLLIARDGQEAIRILQNDLFDIPDFIFLDLNMPVMNGIECLAVLKADNRLKHVPTVVYSTHISAAIEKKVQASNARIFRKPDSYQELLQFLRGLIK